MGNEIGNQAQKTPNEEKSSEKNTKISNIVLLIILIGINLANIFLKDNPQSSSYYLTIVFSRALGYLIAFTLIGFVISFVANRKKTIKLRIRYGLIISIVFSLLSLLPL